MAVINHEEDILKELSLDIPRKILDKFQTLIRESGSEDEKEAFEFLAQLLDEEGIAYEMHSPKIYLSVPVKAQVHVTQPENITLRAKTPAFSNSTFEDEPVDNCELIYIPVSSGEVDLDSMQQLSEEQEDLVKGKVVLTEGFAMPAQVKYFEEMGAVGAVFVNPGKNIHDGICTTIWGSPDLDNYEDEPNIVATAVNKEDGEKLIELCNQGEVTVTLETDLKKGWFECPLLDVYIEGSEEPEKYVLLHGHLDSWTYGLGDNATGDAALMEMARVLHNNRDKLKRSVRIAIWPGHSTGRYAGSTWFADHFAIDLEENCVAQVNCDSPGCRWATSYDSVEWTPEVTDHCQTAIRDAVGAPAKGNRPVRAGDYSFHNIGITSYYMLSSTIPDDLAEEKGYYPVGGCGGNIEWHTEDDLIHIVDEEILMNDMKVYLLSVLRNVNANILPYDFTHTIQDHMSTLKTYQEAVDGHFSFEQVEEDANDLNNELHTFYEKIDAYSDENVNHPIVQEINNTLLQLSRELTRINFSRVGKFRHDPALDVPPLPDIAPALDLKKYDENDHLYFVTLNHLVRGSNRISSVYRQLQRLIERIHSNI